jgi:hypothetical protein
MMIEIINGILLKNPRGPPGFAETFPLTFLLLYGSRGR